MYNALHDDPDYGKRLRNTEKLVATAKRLCRKAGIRYVASLMDQKSDSDLRAIITAAHQAIAEREAKANEALLAELEARSRKLTLAEIVSIR